MGNQDMLAKKLKLPWTLLMEAAPFLVGLECSDWSFTPCLPVLLLQVDKELAKCIELMAEVETAVATKKQHRYAAVQGAFENQKLVAALCGNSGMLSALQQVVPFYMLCCGSLLILFCCAVVCCGYVSVPTAAV